MPFLTRSNVVLCLLCCDEAKRVRGVVEWPSELLGEFDSGYGVFEPMEHLRYLNFVFGGGGLEIFEVGGDRVCKVKEFATTECHF